MSQDQFPQPAEPPRPSNKKWIILGIAGGCSLLAIAAVAISLILVFVPAFSQKSSGQVIATAEVSLSTPVAVEPALAATQPVAPDQPPNSMGNPNATVKIIEYADFQCPYCMQYWQETEPRIVEQYVKTGKVYYEYHSVGAFLGDESGAAAEAAYCAGDQGKFWAYHDTLFSNWTGENVGDFTNDKLLQYAASLGLDKAGFGDCLKSGKYAPVLDQDVKDAQAAGIRATPSFLINGKLVEGALPFENFQQMIEAALQGQ